MTNITRYLLDDQPKPFSHYCHGVRSGNQLWISGTVGSRPAVTFPAMSWSSSRSRWDISTACCARQAASRATS